jgi:hypothetical protein
VEAAEAVEAVEAALAPRRLRGSVAA